MNDDDIYQLVRVGLAELAGQARPADLAEVALWRVRRRRLAVCAGAAGLAGALLIGVPIAVAWAGVAPASRPVAPAASSSLSLPGPAASPGVSRTGPATPPGPAVPATGARVLPASSWPR